MDGERTVKMLDSDISVDMRVSLTKDHLKVKAGEAGVIKAKRFVNNSTVYEIIFDCGTKCFCKSDVLEREGFTKEEILSIPVKPKSAVERTSLLANRVIEDMRILDKLNRLDQRENELKLQLQSISKERKTLKTAARKIEELSRRLTKIKALSDNAIVVQIEEDIKV